MQGARSVDTTGPDAIINAYAGEPQNGLVPTNTAENMGGRVVDALFTGLYTYKSDGTPELANAESVDTTDNQNFTIHLKKDWKFTDGTPVKAENYVRAWNYGAATVNAQLQQSFFSPIEGYAAVAADGSKLTEMSGLKVVDDYTFTVKLTAPNIDFKLGLGFTPFKPVPDVFFTEGAAKFGEHPVGDGAYMMKGPDAWRHNVQIDLVRNPDYKGPDQPRNGGISFLLYSSLDTAYSDLESGNLDVLETLPTSALVSYKRVLGSRAMVAPDASDQTLVIPYYLPHFSGAEGALRRAAISMAIDRQLICDKIFHGSRIPSRDFTARSLPGWNGSIPGSDVLDYNPTKAKQLWAQANAIAPWSGSFQIAYNSDGDHQAWVDAASNSISNTLGIDAHGAPVPTFKQVRDQVTKKTIKTAFRSGWQGDYPTMFDFLVPQFLTGAGSNDAQYASPQFDAELTGAARQLDPAAAYAAVNKAQELLLQALPIIPLWDYIGVGGVGPGVTAHLAWNGLPDYTQITKEPVA
ncbi:peptide ABC transporter substrate-binding protein [Tsukamurella soli]|uniref:ABC transporter substrate-binding protein n=1 Tax=Tsukamurella soli TaxID=644556 RepID=A0ABP8J8D5_9ACTN